MLQWMHVELLSEWVQKSTTYRRTIKEMPADEMEIREAQEEGVRFENLTNPIGIIPVTNRTSWQSQSK